MELRQIRYFVAVAETKSLRNATEKLNIAQPALSHSIKLLEEELGTELFKRSRKGMLLTETGSKFLDSAKLILLEVSRAKERVTEEEENPTGTVNIGMPSSVVKILSVPLFMEVWKRYPNIRLNIEERASLNVRECFDKGEMDLLVYFHVDGVDSIDIEPLIKEELYFIRQANANETLAAEMDFASLADYTLMFPQVAASVNKTLQGLPQREGVQINIMPNKVPIAAVLKLVQEGIACSLAPWVMIDELVTAGKLQAAMVVNPTVTRTINLIRPTNRYCSNATLEVIKVIRQTVKHLQAQNQWRGTLLLDT